MQQTWKLVEDIITPERKTFVSFLNMTIGQQLRERDVRTMTWEAAFEDGDSIPDHPNPGNLHSPWTMTCRSYTASYGQPHSGSVRVSWSQYGTWHNVTEDVSDSE